MRNQFYEVARAARSLQEKQKHPAVCWMRFTYRVDNSLSNLGCVARVVWFSPLSEGAVLLLSAKLTFYVEALLRELSTRWSDNTPPHLCGGVFLGGVEELFRL